MTRACRIVTPGGRTVDLMAPAPQELDESDIATLLARQPVLTVPSRASISQAELAVETARAMDTRHRFPALVGLGASAYFPALPEELLDLPFMGVFCETRREFIRVCWETFCPNYSEWIDDEDFNAELAYRFGKVHFSMQCTYSTETGGRAAGTDSNPPPIDFGRTEPWPTKRAKRNFLRHWHRWSKRWNSGTQGQR